MTNKNEWQPSDVNNFWTEIASDHHVLQVYENDEVFVESLEGFVISGIEKGDSVIVIATAQHTRALEIRLASKNYNVNELMEDGQYIPLNAEETLSKFMRVGWPIEDLFMDLIEELLNKAHSKHSIVRVFSEMVAILWSQGYSGATLQVEHLWNKCIGTKPFCLFHAYPISGFEGDTKQSLSHICAAHSKEIEGSAISGVELHYKHLP